MQDFGAIINNQVLLVSFAASLITQSFKIIVDFIQNGKINFRVLVETGGMPSSHSALVTALAAGVGQVQGWDSTEFAIATVFAIIVMYDASGVRQAAGKQAKVLNQIVDEMFQENPEFNEDRLKELLGHTPFQVIIGSMLGIAISCLFGPGGFLF